MIVGVLAAVMLPLYILQIGMAFAPNQFWRRIAADHREAAMFLWGFGHPFGPRVKVGDPLPWEKHR